MKIEDLFTHGVIATFPSATLDEAADTMRKYHVGALLVMEEEEDGARFPVGMVTDRDMVVQAVANGLSPGAVTVGDVMTRELVTIESTADVPAALERMRTAGVRRLVVTDPNGELAGVLSVDDVIDGLAADLTNLAGLMRGGIQRESWDYHHGHAI
jgi:CBS domain-containing protein